MPESLASRYAISVAHLARAEEVIPLGSQTFSKSRIQYPVGAAPLFATKSKGGRTWDIDGNEYVDLVSSLGAVALGYGDLEIQEAVVRQLQDGVTLSLAHPLEVEVAERLVELIPCAEEVRFGKNGTDATSAAIRLARAHTQRDRIVVCGYHGWQDWYIGSTSMNRGVPASTQRLTHSIEYGNVSAFEHLLGEYPDQIAALIMEPMTSQFPPDGYLQTIRNLTAERGIVLVFDEVLTGFRFAAGGAQEFFGVTPDLATFGKALANGFPLSAIVGKRELLAQMPRIFFSGTFGGETLSLSAAQVVLDRFKTGLPSRSLAEKGRSLSMRIDELRSVESHRFFSLSGHPSWIFHQWTVSDDDVLAQAKTLFLQEILRRNVMVLGTHLVTTAHSSEDIEFAAQQIASALDVVSEGLLQGDIASRLECDVLQPLFRVRG